MSVTRPVFPSSLFAKAVLAVLLGLFLVHSPAQAASKIPVELEIDAKGAAAEDLGQGIERYIRTSDIYVLNKNKVPRVGVSVNAVSKGEDKLVVYSIVVTATVNKCPQAFIGTIFGDNTDEKPADLHKKIEKTLMTVAKELGL